jgi:hypothetical protein
MRRSLMAGAAAGALLIAACGGGGDSNSVKAFCSEYKKVEADLADLDGSDPDAVDAVFDRIHDLDPPDEIKDEFRTMTDFNRSVYTASQDIDLSDPDAAAQLQEELTDRAENLNEDSDKVNDYLSEHCGVGASD